MTPVYINKYADLYGMISSAMVVLLTFINNLEENVKLLGIVVFGVISLISLYIKILQAIREHKNTFNEKD